MSIYKEKIKPYLFSNKSSRMFSVAIRDIYLPAVNNYYNQTYYNQTYYNQTWNAGSDLEPDYSLPMEIVTYFNLTGNPGWYHHRVYNATSDYIITWYINQTSTMQHTFYFIQDSVYDLWNEDKLNSNKQYKNEPIFDIKSLSEFNSLISLDFSEKY